MKKNILAICILVSAALISCNNNEPEQQTSKKGEITFSIPAPSLKSNASNAPVRMIYGELTASNIIFKWRANDVISFEFFNSSKGSISTTSHTVLESEIDEETGALTINIDAPEGTKYVSATSGPDNVPEKQYAVVNGVYNDHMRFEVDKQEVVEGTNTLTLLPQWSAIIISPTYTFYFNDFTETERKHTTSYVGMSNITLTQTIGTETLDVTYVEYEDGEEYPIKRSGNQGAVPVAAYIIVVNPATACDLAITLNYDKQYFYGFSDNDYKGTKFDTSLDETQTTIKVVSMHTENQSVKNLVKGVAYDIDVLQGHPIKIYWKK